MNKRILIIGLASLVGALSGTGVVLATQESAVDDRRSALEMLGVDQSDLRKALDTPSSNGALYVESHDRTRCVTDAGGSGTCQPIEIIEAGRSIGVSFCTPGLAPDRMRVRGLAPTGTSSVEVTYEDGTIRAAELANGVFVLDGPAPSTINGVGPKKVTFMLPDGNLEGPVLYPDEARDAKCSIEDVS